MPSAVVASSCVEAAASGVVAGVAQGLPTSLDRWDCLPLGYLQQYVYVHLGWGLKCKAANAGTALSLPARGDNM
jgi:hypothetical protein